MFDTLLAGSTFLSSMDAAKNKQRVFPAVSGVYCIVHRRSGRAYIGSSCGKLGIRARLQSHISHLKIGDACSPSMQAYYNKYGPTSFDIYLVEETSPAAARERERFYLETYKPWEKGFNSVQVVDDQFEMGDKTKEILAARNSKPFKLESEGVVHEGVNLTAFCKARGLHQGAMTQVLLGNKRQFKGWTIPGKAVQSVSLKYWPTGETFSFPYFGRAAFAREHGIAVSSLTQLCAGRHRITNGWALKETRITEEELRLSMEPRAEKRRRNGRLAEKTTAKSYAVVKDGVVYRGTHRRRFCEERGLNPSSFYALCNGRINSHLGYQRAV